MTDQNLDAPQPPGGPQRTDAPADDADLPAPTHDGDDQDADARELQQENAETSLDQPSS